MTQTCLVVREGRPIGVNNFPVEKTWLGYEAAHKAAIESAIDCADQAEAQMLIANMMMAEPDIRKYGRPQGGDYAFPLENDVPYPIPGLSFRVKSGHPFKTVEEKIKACTYPNCACGVGKDGELNCDPQVAILSLEQSPEVSAAVPKGEVGEDELWEQQELWVEARHYIEVWNIDALFKNFHITRRKDQ